MAEAWRFIRALWARFRRPVAVVVEAPPVEPARPIRTGLEGVFLCHRKRAWALADDAYAALKRIPDTALDVYKCGECGQYHLGHDRVKAGRR